MTVLDALCAWHGTTTVVGEVDHDVGDICVRCAGAGAVDEHGALIVHTDEIRPALKVAARRER